MKLKYQSLCPCRRNYLGINCFALTWWMMLFDGMTGEVTIIGRMYRGFSLSPIGSLYALLWGFMDGFLIGLMVAWIYNKLIPRLRSKEE